MHPKALNGAVPGAKQSLEGGEEHENRCPAILSRESPKEKWLMR